MGYLFLSEVARHFPSETFRIKLKFFLRSGSCLFLGFWVLFLLGIELKGFLLRCLNLWESCVSGHPPRKKQKGRSGSCAVSIPDSEASTQFLLASTLDNHQVRQPVNRWNHRIESEPVSLGLMTCCIIIFFKNNNKMTFQPNIFSGLFVCFLFFCILKQLPEWTTEQGSRCQISLLTCRKRNRFDYGELLCHVMNKRGWNISFICLRRSGSEKKKKKRSGLILALCLQPPAKQVVVVFFHFALRMLC